MKSNLTGIQKLALLTRVVGYDSMVPILRNLKLSEEVYAEIDAATPETVSKNDAIAVLREFNASASLVVGGHRESLIEAIEDIGLENGNLGKFSRKMHGFKKLATKQADEVCNLIRGEQPLHQAIILFQMPEKLSVDTFSLLTVEEQALVTKEADKAETPSNETLMAINTIIEEIITNKEAKSTGNIERIYAFTDNMDEDRLEEYLTKLPSDIAEKIKANVLTFTHIIQQDEKVLSDILGEIATTDIAFAFCLSDATIIEKMKSTLTQTKAQDVSFSIEKNVDKNDKKSISEAQRRIILKAKALQNDGKIEIIR